MAFCANCGTQLADDAKFCPGCGQAVNAAPVTPATPVAPEAPAAPVAPETPVAPEAPAAPTYQAAPQYQAPQYQAPPQQPQQAPNNFVSTVQNFNNTADTTGEYDPADIQSGRGIAWLSYLGALCFIPMFAAKANRYVQFHVRQGFTLFVGGVGLWLIQFITGLIFAKRWYGLVVGYTWPYYIFAVLCWIGYIFITVLSIIGIVNACKGRAKELPLIGKIDILGMFKK